MVRPDITNWRQDKLRLWARVLLLSALVASQALIWFPHRSSETRSPAATHALAVRVQDDDSYGQARVSVDRGPLISVAAAAAELAACDPKQPVTLRVESGVCLKDLQRLHEALARENRSILLSLMDGSESEAERHTQTQSGAEQETRE